MHPAIQHVLQFFKYDHLPDHLQKASKPFAELAIQVAERAPENQETTVALRKLLEAKDAAVRAVLTIITILLTLLPSVCQAGGPCRTFRSFRSKAVVVQPNAYYQVQQQKAAPFLYSGDVDNFLKIQQEVMRLEQGLATNQLNHEQKMMQIQQSTYQLRALSQQQMRIQALKQCDDSPAPAADIPPVPGAAAPGDGKVLAIFNRSCVSCHGDNPKSGFQLLAGGQITQDARGKAYCIVGHVATGDMPKRGQPLSDEDIQAIAEWAAGQ